MRRFAGSVIKETVGISWFYAPLGKTSMARTSTGLASPAIKISCALDDFFVTRFLPIFLRA